MKILQINIVNETGSTGRIMQGISKSLKSNGFLVYTAYGYGKSNLSNSVKIGNKLTYMIHNLGSKFFCAQGLFSKRSTKKLIRFIDNEKIDLIHLHNIHGNYLNYVLLFNYIKEKDIPIIWTLHDCWPFTGKCVYFDICKCTKWKNECNHCPIKKEYPKSYFIDSTRRNYYLKKQSFTSVDKMVFVSPSNWLKDLFKQSFLHSYPIYVINNGINLNVFKPIKSNLKKKYNLIGKKIILGVASPWNRRKGYIDFLELAEVLDNTYKIVMIGVSSRQKESINKNIIALEKTNSINELAEWYSTADVFVNLTYEDNFPTVNLEALACGTPVITYNTGGSIEVINKKTGIVCEQGNIMEVKESIDWVCTHKSNYLDCRIFALRNFNQEVKNIEYVDLYNKFLRGHCK